MNLTRALVARPWEDRKTLFGFFVGGAASADSFRPCAAEVEVAVQTAGVYRCQGFTLLV